MQNVDIKLTGKTLTLPADLGATLLALRSIYREEARRRVRRNYSASRVARYTIQDWTSENAVQFSTNNIHEAREMVAQAASLGLNPNTTYIWDRQLACPAVA